MVLEMIIATLSKGLFKILEEYANYWGSTRQNLQKLTQLQIIQGFLPAGMWQNQLEYYVYTGQK